VLHSAQAKCQIAYKELNLAESVAADLEAEAAQLVQDLQEKVQQLADAQSEVHNARQKYDAAAKVAQDEVQKLRSVPTDVQSNFSSLLKSMSPEQLEEASDAMAKAAKAARENVDLSDPARTPGNSPVLASQGEPAAKKAETAATDGSTKHDVSMAAADTILAQGGIAFPLSPPSFVGGGLPPPVEVFAGAVLAPTPNLDALDEAARLAACALLLVPPIGGRPAPEPSPLLDGSTKERDGSRSPRRQEQLPAEGEQDGISPLSKVQRGNSDSDALSARARSHSSAPSARSTKTLPAAHYDHIAEGLREQIANMQTTPAVTVSGSAVP